MPGIEDVEFQLEFLVMIDDLRHLDQVDAHLHLHRLAWRHLQRSGSPLLLRRLQRRKRCQHHDRCPGEPRGQSASAAGRPWRVGSRAKPAGRVVSAASPGESSLRSISSQLPCASGVAESIRAFVVGRSSGSAGEVSEPSSRLLLVAWQPIGRDVTNDPRGGEQRLPACKTPRSVSCRLANRRTKPPEAVGLFLAGLVRPVKLGGIRSDVVRRAEMLHLEGPNFIRCQQPAGQRRLHSVRPLSQTREDVQCNSG